MNNQQKTQEPKVYQLNLKQSIEFPRKISLLFSRYRAILGKSKGRIQFYFLLKYAKKMCQVISEYSNYTVPELFALHIDEIQGTVNTILLQCDKDMVKAIQSVDYKALIEKEIKEKVVTPIIDRNSALRKEAQRR